MPAVDAAALLSHLRSREVEMLDLLARLAAAESPSTLPAAQLAAQELLRGELQALGFRVRHVPGVSTGGHLVAFPETRRRGAPCQLLLGHSDTVWPLGSTATLPIRRRGDRFTGPGVYDMKAGLVLMIAALAALRDLQLEPSVTPVCLVTSDEEIGSPESGRLVRRLARLADRVLVLEPAFGRRGRLKTARKGVGKFVVRVQGRAAHSGLEPRRGISAIRELADVVQQIFALNEIEPGLTLNVGTIGGGTGTNVVASESWATVDVRVLSERQAKRIESALRSLRPRSPGARLRIEGEMHAPPLERTPRNRVLWRLARRLGRELGLELGEALAGGASDGNTASLFAATLDGLGAVGGGAHAAREFVHVPSLAERGALLALLLVAPALFPRSIDM